MAVNAKLVRFSSEGCNDDDIAVHQLDGTDDIGHLFRFTVTLHTRSVTAALDEAALLGRPATIDVQDPAGRGARWHGVIHSLCECVAAASEHLVYRVEVVPRAHALALGRTSAVFVDRSVPDIIAAKLEAAGFALGVDFELRLVTPYPTREFVLQYEESDWSFVSRLAEHVGVAMSFEHKSGRDVLVFTDDASTAPQLAGEPVALRPRGGRAGVYELEAKSRTTAASVVVRDYNYRTPQVRLEQSTPVVDGSSGVVVEFGAHATTQAESEFWGRIRSEEVAVDRRVLSGRSDDGRFAAGTRVAIEGPARLEGGHRLLRVHHRARQHTWAVGDVGEEEYWNAFEAIPESVPFRPRRLTPKPRIHGVVNAHIESEQAGEYAEMDEHGRYHVRLLLDPGSAAPGKASSLIRMAQPHAGPGYGLHLPLRDGVEVLVSFVEGDPDRPVIVGAVPNPATPSVVNSGNATRNILRTGGGTELNIDDTQGGTRFKVTVPFLNTTLQMGAPNAPTRGFFVGTEGDASFRALEQISLQSTSANISLDAFTSISLHANNSIGLSADQIDMRGTSTIDGTTKKLHLTGTESVKLESEGSVDVTGKASATMAGTKATVDGWSVARLTGRTADVDGAHVIITGTTDVVVGNKKIQIKGTDVTVDATKLTLKGGGATIVLSSGGITIDGGGKNVVVTGAEIRLNC